MEPIIKDTNLRTRYNRIAGIVLIPFIVIGGYALFLHSQVSNIVQDHISLQRKFDSAALTATHFRNKDSLDVVQNITLQAQNDGTLKEMSATQFKLSEQVERNVKAINYYAKLVQKTTLPQVIIHYDSNSKIPLVASRRSDSIGVPQKFSYSDSLYSIKGAVTKEGIRLDSPEIYNTVYLRSGVRKYGFLNMRREDFVQAVNSNRYVQATGLAEIHLKRKPNTWNRWIKPMISFAAGGYLMYQLRK